MHCALCVQGLGQARLDCGIPGFRVPSVHLEACVQYCVVCHDPGVLPRSSGHGALSSFEEVCSIALYR